MTATHGPASGAARAFLDAAVAQTGDTYVFATNTAPDDPDPEVFDCSELVRWAARRAGVTVPDGSWLQYLSLSEQGGEISVEEALQTPGALLFSFSSKPTATSGRPDQAHVAISLGNGQTIEARGPRWGVGSWDAAGRFQYAAVIPGLGLAVPAGASPDAGPSPEAGTDPPSGEPVDPEGDGLTTELEKMLRTDPADADTDGDGLSDGFEMTRSGTDPLSGDMDDDDVPDAVELLLGTDPRAPAGVGGAGSLSAELDALMQAPGATGDSDGDGFVDWQEESAGTDPVDATSSPLAQAPGPDLDESRSAGSASTVVGTDVDVDVDADPAT